MYPTSSRRRQRADRARIPAWRTALTLLLMLAATAQGVIAQGHVHFRFAHTATVGAVVVSAPATTEGGSGDGARGDPSTCALCQALASGAAPLGPAPRFSLPFAALRSAVPAKPARPALVSAVSHIWTSRGPPSI